MKSVEAQWRSRQLRKLWPGALGAMLAVVWTLAAQDQAQTPAPGHADTYAIYSVMLSSYPEAGKESTIALSPTTGEIPGGLLRGGDPCMTVSEPYADRWSQVLADFRARGTTPVALVPDLKISKPYIFVTAEEQKAFVATRPGPPLRNPPAVAPEVPERLRGVIHIISFYNVYFDKDRTLALTGISNYCGPLCAKAQLKLFEKRNGVWSEVRPASLCMIVA